MGCGKSTLTRLICGVLEPDTGSVLIDDVDVRQIDKDDLIAHLGIMLQESWLYSGTLRENITLGFGHYSDEDIQRAAELSGAHSFISQNPQGYDFPVSEKGAGLSGGQKQSLSLARTLVRDPDILILDEPTSAMDQASEAAVIKSLEGFLKGKTSILVTHRNTLLSLCDRVIVLEQGKIIADTTPAQLGIKTS
jgi:ATP-binding cassette subfamily C protein LapB